MKITHRCPLGADLPLAADLGLAGAGRLGPLQVPAAAGVDVEGAVGVHLAAQHLAVLHAQATCLTALRPLPDVPAERGGVTHGINGHDMFELEDFSTVHDIASCV